MFHFLYAALKYHFNEPFLKLDVIEVKNHNGQSVSLKHILFNKVLVIL